MSTQITVESLRATLERLPPYQLAPLLALYREKRQQQRRELPIIEETLTERLARATEEADAYIEATKKLAAQLAGLTPTPAPEACPEFGV